MFRIPIFLSSDNNYAPFVATTIASICDNTKSFVDFYILDGGITQENQEKICKLKNKFNNFSIEFIKIDVDKYFKDFVETSYITKSMYNRFLIPDLKPQIDKALYSDVDVIVLGDIAEMYNENLNGYILGAVWEEMFDNTDNVKSFKKNMNVSLAHKYFSSGNLLIDCKEWRENNVLDKLMTLGQHLRDVVLSCPDQDLLNVCFDNNYQKLDQKYCYMNQKYDFYKNHNVCIRHYNGQIKPWHINPNTKTSLYYNLEDFWKYAKMTSFYTEMFVKTQDKEEQNKYIRQLQYWKNVNKVSKILNKTCEE